jgi:bifunctional DNA-binding transcriptional regulator/antitoxin component of YhaV-PrlF toxin-antitoxin module
MGVKFIGKAKITRQGQVTLPFEAREDLKLDLNSEVYWYLVDNHLVVVKELVSVDELISTINKRKPNKKLKFDN